MGATPEPEMQGEGTVFLKHKKSVAMESPADRSLGQGGKPSAGFLKLIPNRNQRARKAM